MKTWQYDQIEQAAKGCIGGTLAEWPYLREALVAEGISLPQDTLAAALTAICKLVLNERKTASSFVEHSATISLQEYLLRSEVYANRSDISEIYSDYCMDFASVGWVGDLSHWDAAKHISPVDYIISRLAKCQLRGTRRS